MPRYVARRAALVSFVSPQKIAPVSAWTSPASKFSSVDFPEPDSPRMLTLSPANTSKLLRFNTPIFRSPLGYVLLTCRAERITALLTAKRLHRFEFCRAQCRQQPGQRGYDDRSDNDFHHVRNVGVRRQSAKLIKAPEHFFALTRARDAEYDVVSKREHDEPQTQSHD